MHVEVVLQVLGSLLVVPHIGHHVLIDCLHALAIFQLLLDMLQFFQDAVTFFLDFDSVVDHFKHQGVVFVCLCLYFNIFILEFVKDFLD